MKRFLIVTLFLVSILVNLLPKSFVKASIISSITPIGTIGIPQNEFIGSATLAEVNFFENDFDTRYIFPMQGLTVTEDGFIAVIDNAYGIVHVLTPLLQEKFTFGSIRDFTYPTDISFSTGRFYVTDPFRKEIRIYDKNGVYLKSIKNSSFTSPIGIAANSSNIFVSDYFSNTIFKLDLDGKVSSFTNVSTPLGLNLDSKGNIYAISGKERRVYAFDSNFKLLKAFGDDVLVFPSDIATDSKGYIYVVDRGLSSTATNSPKVLVFDNNFKLTNSFGTFSNSTTSIPDGAFLTPSGIAISPTNSVYVFDSGYFFFTQSNSDAPFGYPIITRISVFNTLGYFVNKKDFVRDSNKGVLLNPTSASLDENGYTWALNKGNLDQSEILKFSPEGTLALRITKIGTQNLPSLNYIYADKRGNILAIGNNQVLLFSSNGSFKQNILNSNLGLLKKITFYNGYYWVTSQDNNKVFKLDSTFKIIGSFSVCSYPSGIAFDSKGKAFITSLYDNMVHVYDENFKEILKFGGSGKSNFKMYIPEDISIDKEDNVYIANTENGKITVFTSSGAPLFETDPYYLGLTSIEVENSHIIASDAFHNVIWIFEIKKQYLDYSFTLSVSPDQVSISPSDFANIYFTITNTGLKSDTYTYSVSLTNNNLFKYTLFDTNTSFTLLPSSSKRIRVFIESNSTVKEGDSTQIIFKVTSSNLKYSSTTTSVIKISTNLKPGILVDEASSQLGTNVAVPVYIKNPIGIRGVSFNINFDKSKVAFISLTLNSSISGSLVLTSSTDTGVSVMIEFPRDDYLFSTTKVGTLNFRGVSIGSSVLQVTNARYATVTDEIVDFENVYPGGITITPYLQVDLPEVYSTTSQIVNITGKTTSGCSVSLNGVPISVGNDGSFSYKLTLSSYETNLIISSKAKTGEETTVYRTIKFSGKLKLTLILQINNPIMYVNGLPEEIDPGRGTTPIIVQGWNRTVVPIRAIVEKLGGTVGWDGDKKVVSITLKDKSINLQIGNSIAVVNGKEVQIDPSNPLVKPIIINERTMVPLRFVAEQLGCNVSWDEKQKKITVEYTMP